MKSKTMYNNRATISEIKKSVDSFSGKSYTIYCTDTDDLLSNTEHKMQFDEIDLYCKQNGYEHVWFCRDMEEVYIGKRVANDKKVSEAAKFQSNGTIVSVNADKLRANDINIGKSNILNVLEKYLYPYKKASITT